MEKINKKITYIEKTLNKMRKEISSIKNTTYNKKATNSYNNRNYFINKNYSMNTIKGNLLNNKKQYTPKNYFKLTEKEKKYYENKNKKEYKSQNSSVQNKKGLNIYNNIIDWSTEKNNNEITNTDNDKIKNNIEQKTKTIYNNNDNDNDNDNDNNNDMNKCKKFNRMSILNEEISKNINNNSFENNFGYESHNLFFDYNYNGENEGRNRVFSNIMRKNKSENKDKKSNNFTNEQQNLINKSNKILTKKIYNKLYNLKYDNIKNENNKIWNEFNNLINDDKNYDTENKEDISNTNTNNNIEVSKLKPNKRQIQDYNSIINKNIGNEYYILNGNNKKYKKNKVNKFNLNNKYRNFFVDENYKNNKDFNYKNNINHNHNNKLFYKYENNENIDDIYLEIMNILDGNPIDEINDKANLFDKYGSNGFEKYLNNQQNTTTSNTYNIYENLLNYKKYISSLKIKNKYEYIKQINSYKNLCNKLLNITDSHSIQKIAENINYKLKRNQYNKNVLEKVKNILFELIN